MNPGTKIDFSCRECGHALRVAVGLAGRRARCPRCQAELEIPFAPAPTASELESAPPDVVGEGVGEGVGQAAQAGEVVDPTALAQGEAGPPSDKVDFGCPSCGHAMRIDARFRGRRVRCRGCQDKLTVPPSEAAAPQRRSASPPPIEAETRPARAAGAPGRKARRRAPAQPEEPRAHPQQAPATADLAKQPRPGGRRRRAKQKRRRRRSPYVDLGGGAIVLGCVPGLFVTSLAVGAPEVDLAGGLLVAALGLPLVVSGVLTISTRAAWSAWTTVGLLLVVIAVAFWKTGGPLNLCSAGLFGSALAFTVSQAIAVRRHERRHAEQAAAPEVGEPGVGEASHRLARRHRGG